MRTAGESGVVLEVLSLKDRNPPFVGAGCEPIVIAPSSTPPQIRGTRYTGRARDIPLLTRGRHARRVSGLGQSRSS
jgi:hypothetical protein